MADPNEPKDELPNQPSLQGFIDRCTGILLSEGFKTVDVNGEGLSISEITQTLMSLAFSETVFKLAEDTYAVFGGFNDIDEIRTDPGFNHLKTIVEAGLNLVKENPDINLVFIGFYPDAFLLLGPSFAERMLVSRPFVRHERIIANIICIKVGKNSRNYIDFKPIADAMGNVIVLDYDDFEASLKASVKTVMNKQSGQVTAPTEQNEGTQSEQ